MVVKPTRMLALGALLALLVLPATAHGVVAVPVTAITGGGSIPKSNVLSLNVYGGLGSVVFSETTGPQRQIVGNVACYTVVGNKAVIAYYDSGQPTPGGVVYVEDDGAVDKQKNGRLTTKKLSQLIGGGCQPPATWPAMTRLAAGSNLVVHDCDDSNPDTTDSYDPTTQSCKNEPVFIPPDCDDGDVDTIDFYNPLSGECIHIPSGVIPF